MAISSIKQKRAAIIPSRGWVVKQRTAKTVSIKPKSKLNAWFGADYSNFVAFGVIWKV